MNHGKQSQTHTFAMNRRFCISTNNKKAKKQSKKKQKKRSSRKRKYGALTLTQTDSINNTQIIKKRKINTYENNHINTIANENIFPNSHNTNVKTVNTVTNQLNNVDEITQFDNDNEFIEIFKCSQAINIHDFGASINHSNQSNNPIETEGQMVIDDDINDGELMSFMEQYKQQKQQQQQQPQIKNDKEEKIERPNDYEIDYTLIRNINATSTCKYHEKMIRHEQKKQYDEYEKHLKKLNADLNNKNKKNEVFNWKLIEYKNDSKQIITLNQIYVNKHNKISYQLQK
eukprot:363919_1